jgi:hypothetical protein
VFYSFVSTGGEFQCDYSSFDYAQVFDLVHMKGWSPNQAQYRNALNDIKWDTGLGCHHSPASMALPASACMALVKFALIKPRRLRRRVLKARVVFDERCSAVSLCSGKLQHTFEILSRIHIVARK